MPLTLALIAVYLAGVALALCRTHDIGLAMLGAALAERPHRLWRNGLGLDVFADAPALFAIAIALGFVVQHSESIWPAVLFHTSNNTLAGVL